ncbi:60S ribosomal protein L12 [Zostera marina]|uniref:60S ribosomal protein L12 n=1 Tax=Zostera marina TaxID=29655 RepID=A0A0K9P0H8_ZOSMR|nr:60S ribosomal protein L12 [Zostera marina]
MEEEFDESEVLWGCREEDQEGTKKPISKWNRRKSECGPKLEEEEDEHRTVVCSLPVKVPVVWLSTEMEKESRNSTKDVADDDKLIPPHEYLWRQRRMNGVVSFSVHEGVGRTLKGRDLSRVRNAVWAKIGFQD